MIPKRLFVSVRYREADDVSSVTGLIVCGSGWLCPVCAAKITEERRRNLTVGITEARKLGWQVALLTLTLRHGKQDPLRELLRAIHAGWTSVSAGRAGDELRHQLGMIGYILSREVTYGQKGWHPHLHVLLFLAPEADLAQLEAFIRARWGAKMAALGHDVNHAGVKLQTTYGAVGDYIAKWGHEPATEPWGVEAEMSKWHTKKGHDGGMTPFDLLAASLNGFEPAGPLFVEYAQAFKGMHQHQWSKGLRKLLQVGDELSDQEIAETAGEDMPEVARLSRAQWRYIVGIPAVAELLVAVRQARGDRAGIRAFLQLIGCPDLSTWQGWNESEEAIG